MLDLLDPPESVYDSQADDLLALIAPEQNQLDAFIAALDSQQQDLAGGISGVDASLDQADSAITAIGQIFDTLAAEQRAVDLSAVILDVLGQENQLDANLDGFAPDVESAGLPLIQAISDAIISVAVSILNILIAALNDVISFILSILGYLFSPFPFF